MKLPKNALFKTTKTLRNGEYKLHILHSEGGQLRIVAEDSFFKQHVLETSADEVYAYLDDDARAIIVEDGTETDYVSVFQAICRLLALKSLKVDRRKKHLVLRVKRPITREKKAKTPRKQQGRKNGRVVSVAYTSSESEAELDLGTIGSAATAINAVARGHLDRFYSSIVELELIFNDAATAINACARGFLTRKHFDDLYDNFLIQRDLEGNKKKASLDEGLEKEEGEGNGEDHFLWVIIQEESATAIQAIARGMLARKRVNGMVMKKRFLKDQQITDTIWNESKTFCAMFSESNVAIFNENFEEEFNLADRQMAGMRIGQKIWKSNDSLAFERNGEKGMLLLQKQDGRWKRG